MIRIMKILLTLTAFTPFIIFKNNFFPYVSGESFYLRVILVLVGILFIYFFFSNKEFKDNILNKINILIKNKIFIFTSILLVSTIISTIFAVDKTSAFWGTLERMEGLSAYFYFFLLFIFSVLIFEKKDWINFFKVVLFVTLILFIKEVIQFIGGVSRPQSFVDNPIFLAGYFLFSIASALIVFQSSSSFWKYFSSFVVVISFVGIFLTQTRGTMLGLFVGLFFSLIYTLIKTYKSKDKTLKRYKVLSIISLILIVLFSLTFVLTRGNAFWQKVPGLSRAAKISVEDDTTSTRLLMTKVSLNAINPTENGAKKLLLGWGPENFSIAYGNYFDPKQFDFEMVWFDRPHNKIFDLLVSLGIIGLLSYLILYFYFIKSAFKEKEFSFQNVSILFFSLSFLTHLYFVFDHITTSVPFFLLLSFAVLLTSDFNKKLDSKNKSKIGYTFISFIVLLTIIISFIFIRDTLPSYLKSKKYMNFKRNKDIESIYKNFDYFTDIYNTSRSKIIIDIINNNKTNKENPVPSELLMETLSKGEEIALLSPYNIKIIVNLGIVYSSLGKDLKNDDLLKKGEKYLKQLVIFSPDRPDLNLGMAINMYHQKRYSDSLYYLNKVLSVSNEYYKVNKKYINAMYMNILKDFYNQKDKENFVKVLESIIYNGYEGDIPARAMLDFVQKYKIIPRVDFE